MANLQDAIKLHVEARRSLGEPVPSHRALRDRTCPSSRTNASVIGGSVSAKAMRQIIVDVPEKVLLAEKTDEATFARELRMLAAVKLYELGRLSSGRAAELAGMSRVEFLLALGRYKVFPLEAELRDLEAKRG